MASFEHRLPADAAEADLLALVARLNADPAVHGILVQLRLLPQMDAARVIDAIDPAKDVDGFHIANVGRLGTGQPAMVPCAPLGCLMLLRDRLGNLAGLEAVIVGRSNIVGKPMAQLLLAESCTVTIAHSRTRDLAATCRRADILVAAVGRPGLIRGDWVKPDATVIDVGTNRVERDGAQRLGGRCRFRRRVGCRRCDHPCAGWRRADDHRLPSGEYAHRGLSRRRLSRPRRPDAAQLNPQLNPMWGRSLRFGRYAVRRARGRAFSAGRARFAALESPAPGCPSPPQPRLPPSVRRRPGRRSRARR